MLDTLLFYFETIDNNQPNRRNFDCLYLHKNNKNFRLDDDNVYAYLIIIACI